MSSGFRRTIIPFNEFLPDKGLLGNPGLTVADDCTPLGSQGFVPNPLLTVASAAVGAATGILGELHVNPFGGVTPTVGYQLFLGADDNKLYRIVPSDYLGTTWGAQDRTRTVGGNYSVESWHFASFGEAVVAVPGITDEMQILLPAATSFVKLVSGTSPDDFKSRYVAPLRNRLLLAYELFGGTTYPNRVRWSVSNDITTYGDPASLPAGRTYYEDLEDDYGEITGIVSGTDYAHVFKKRASYRMAFGGPFEFGFIPSAIGHGTVFPHSLAVLGSRVYFWGPAGPSVILENLEAQPLGLDSFSRSLQDESWFLETPISLQRSATTQVYAAVDPANEMVYWLYNATGVDATTEGRILFIYNARHGRGSIQRSWLPTLQTPAFAPQAIAFRPMQPTWPWSPVRDLLVVGTEQSTPVVVKVAYFDPLREVQCRFRNGYSEIVPGSTCRIVGVRPIFSFNAENQGPEDFEVTIRSINQPWGTTPRLNGGPRNAVEHADKNGFIRFPNSDFARWHSFDCLTGGGESSQILVTDDGTEIVTDTGLAIEVFTANASRLAEIEGLEVEYEEGPEYAG